MKFITLVNLDDLEIKRKFIAGVLKLQRGNWIKMNGVKGRVMGKSFEFSTGSYVNAVFPQNVETRLDAMVDAREQLAKFLGDKLLFTFDSWKFLPKKQRYILYNVKHSWGTVATSYINIRAKDFHKHITQTGTRGFFFGEVVKYDKKYKFSINPKTLT